MKRIRTTLIILLAALMGFCALGEGAETNLSAETPRPGAIAGESPAESASNPEGVPNETGGESPLPSDSPEALDASEEKDAPPRPITLNGGEAAFILCPYSSGAVRFSGSKDARYGVDVSIQCDGRENASRQLRPRQEGDRWFCVLSDEDIEWIRAQDCDGAKLTAIYSDAPLPEREETKAKRSIEVDFTPPELKIERIISSTNAIELAGDRGEERECDSTTGEVWIDTGESVKVFLTGNDAARFECEVEDTVRSKKDSYYTLMTPTDGSVYRFSCEDAHGNRSQSVSLTIRHRIAAIVPEDTEWPIGPEYAKTTIAGTAQPNSMLRLTCQKRPTLDRDVPVDPDGRWTMPLEAIQLVENRQPIQNGAEFELVFRYVNEESEASPQSVCLRWEDNWFDPVIVAVSEGDTQIRATAAEGTWLWMERTDGTPVAFIQNEAGQFSIGLETAARAGDDYCVYAQDTLGLDRFAQTITAHRFNGSVPEIRLTADYDRVLARIHIWGTAAPGCRVQLSLDGQNLADPIVVDQSGQFVRETPCTDGEHNLSARYDGYFENQSFEDLATILVDTQPPMLEEVPASIEDTSTGFEFSVSESATVTASLDGRPLEIDDLGGNRHRIQLDPKALTGAHQIVIFASDSQDNTSGKALVDIQGTKPIRGEILSPAEGSVLNSEGHCELTGRVESRLSPPETATVIVRGRLRDGTLKELSYPLQRTEETTRSDELFAYSAQWRVELELSKLPIGNLELELWADGVNVHTAHVESRRLELPGLIIRTVLFGILTVLILALCLIAHRKYRMSKDAVIDIHNDDGQITL